MLFLNRLIKYSLRQIRLALGIEAIHDSLFRNKIMLCELLMSQVFHDCITDCSWLKTRNFAPIGAAANYSLLYVVFRVFNEFKPNNILELGIGQTSKISMQYVNYGKDSACLTLVDDDKYWVEFSKPLANACSRIKFLTLDKELIDFRGFKTEAYKDLGRHHGSEKFDCVIIDGPNGSAHYSRVGICSDLISKLASRFVRYI